MGACVPTKSEGGERGIKRRCGEEQRSNLVGWFCLGASGEHGVFDKVVWHFVRAAEWNGMAQRIMLMKWMAEALSFIESVSNGEKNLGFGGFSGRFCGFGMEAKSTWRCVRAVAWKGRRTSDKRQHLHVKLMGLKLK